MEERVPRENQLPFGAERRKSNPAGPGISAGCTFVLFVIALVVLLWVLFE